MSHFSCCRSLQTLPAEPTTIAADVDSASLVVRINGDESVDEAMPADQLEIAQKTMVVSD